MKLRIPSFFLIALTGIGAGTMPHLHAAATDASNPLVTVYSPDPSRCPPTALEFASIKNLKQQDLINAADVEEFVQVMDKAVGAGTYDYADLFNSFGKDAVVALSFPHGFKAESDCHASYYVPSWKDYHQCVGSWGVQKCRDDFNIFEISPIKSKNAQHVFLEFVRNGVEDSSIYQALAPEPSMIGNIAHFDAYDDLFTTYQAADFGNGPQCSHFIAAPQGPLFHHSGAYRGVIGGRRLCHIEVRLGVKTPNPPAPMTFLLSETEWFNIQYMTVRIREADGTFTEITPYIKTSSDGKTWSFSVTEPGEYWVEVLSPIAEGYQWGTAYVYEVDADFNGTPSQELQSISVP